uniref:NAA35-like TPR repeats domain-containing protein n=1 Tax=Chloropicon laureae TaxID=464258 RepID=A0A7S3E341_9CHLO
MRSLQALLCKRMNLEDLVCASLGVSTKGLEQDREFASCLADCTGILEMHNNAACRNKCQQHRKCKKVLRELNLKLLQREGSLSSAMASKLNLNAPSAGGGAGALLVKWIELLGHSIALKQLLVGFDLELYETSDFLMIYWYCERLLSGYIDKFQEARDLAQQGVKGSPSKGKKKGSKGKKEGGFLDENGVMGRLFVLESTRLVLSGIVRMLAALKKQGIIQPASSIFNTEEHRYVQRFSHFLDLHTPLPLGYGEYVYATTVDEMSVTELCESAKKSFENSLRVTSHLKATLPAESKKNEKELHDLERISKRNMVGLALVVMGRFNLEHLTRILV